MEEGIERGYKDCQVPTDNSQHRGKRKMGGEGTTSRWRWRAGGEDDSDRQGQTNEAWQGAIQTNKTGETEDKTEVRRLRNNLNGKRI